MSISILKGDFTKEWRFFASADFGGVWRRNIRADCVQISTSPRAIEGVEMVALRLTSYRDGRLNRLIGAVWEENFRSRPWWPIAVNRFV